MTARRPYEDSFQPLCGRPQDKHVQVGNLGHFCSWQTTGPARNGGVLYTPGLSTAAEPSSVFLDRISLIEGLEQSSRSTSGNNREDDLMGFTETAFRGVSELWVGVGIDTNVQVSTMVPSEITKELADTIELSSNSARGLTNPAFAQDNCKWYSPGINTALASTLLASKIKPDWRRPCLKIALYDVMREKTITQPAGVPFDCARFEAPQRTTFSRRILDDWDYRVAFIDIPTWERAINLRRLEVDGEDWDPTGSRTSVIFMDSGVSDPLLHAL